MNHRELAVPRDAAKGWGPLDHGRPAKQEEIEPPVQTQRRSEVVKDETVVGYVERLRGRVAVDTEAVLDAQPSRLGEPHAGPATDVDDRRRSEPLDDDGKHALGGAPRRGLDP